jgi:hypothetical protein
MEHLHMKRFSLSYNDLVTNLVTKSPGDEIRDHTGPESQKILVRGELTPLTSNNRKQQKRTAPHGSIH